MNKFCDFEKNVNEHAQELAYDTASLLTSEWKPELTLSQADITLITKISQNGCLALMRQYHNWLMVCQAY